jgi:carbon-monoxide dehydrogenase medium subunit
MNINAQNTHIIPFKFQYYSPKTIEEATILLQKYPGSKILAGGTDLLPKMKQRIIEPKHIINIKKIENLVGIKKEGDHIIIGALNSLRSIEKNKLIQNKLSLLYQAVKSIGSIQIRNIGTIGGNICNASPAADGALGLIVLDAITKIVGVEEERQISLHKFFTGPGTTTLEEGEILKEIKVQIPKKETGGCFISIGRTSLDISTISVATLLNIEGDKINKARIAFGSAAPTPLRLYELEEELQGKKPTIELMKKLGDKASKIIKPITDVRGTKEYRSEAARGLLVESLKQSWDYVRER